MTALHDKFMRSTKFGSLADVLFKPIESEGVTPIIVDAGARNGMMFSSAYAKRARLIGFEPNLDEFNKLVARSTDAMKAGVPMATFLKEEYHNCALWDRDEERPFYITAGAGACTLMGEANRAIAGRMWLDSKNARERPYADLHTEVKKTSPIRCQRLDSLIDNRSVVDFFKLDVEGAELAVLRGASRLFEEKRVLMIKTEFVFTPYYQVHPIFGYQHVFLHEKGYRLLSMDFQQPSYTRDKTDLASSADRRLTYAGDAYFSLDPDLNSLSPMALYRMGVASIALGFNSFGVSLLSDSKLIPSESLKEIELALRHVPWKRRCRNYWNRIPYQIAQFLRII